MEPVDALPAGLLFSEWVAARGCAKSTAYRMRAELGITAERRRRGNVVEVWLSQAQADLLTDYAEALSRGLSTADALAAVGRGGALVESGGASRLAPMDSDGPAPAESDGAPQEPVESDGLARLRDRMAALRDALDLGAPLTTREVALLLGARPGGAVVQRGRVVAVHLARNLWQLEASD